MHRCECAVISLSYKCQCILICTYTVNEVNLNLFLVWPRSLEWTVDGCKNGSSKWTNYKIFYMSFWLERLHLITNIYIRVQFLFSKRGACFYWVPCFYWDIYGICHTAIVGIIYYCTRIGVSVLRTGRGRAGGGRGRAGGGGGGGGGVEYLTEIFFSLRNVPGVLKRQKKKKINGGGRTIFFPY